MPISLLLLAVLPLAPHASAAVPPEWAADHLGVYLWPTYPRLDGFTLPELTPTAEALGTRVVRVPLEAHFGREAGWDDLLRAPATRACVERFPTVVLTLSDHSGRQYEAARTQQQYAEVTTYLLRTYRDSGKTFVLGLWESDHWLPLDERGLGFLQARQAGMDEARRSLPPSGLRILSMVEVTKAEGDCVATKLLPSAPPEVLSLSWWAHASDVGGALRKLKALVPSATLMVGELGLSGRRSDPDRPAKLLAAIDASREAGAEWVILWRLDDWEYGLIGSKPDGGDTTDLWSAIEPLLHPDRGGRAVSWRWPDGRRREETLLEPGATEAALPGALDALAFSTSRGARDLTLAGDAATITLASTLPPRSRFELRADGRGSLQIGPVWADSAEQWAPWQTEGLTWNREFAVWQPAARGAEGFVEASVESEYPILDGSLWLCGRKANAGDWGVRVQGYEGEWLDCPQVYDWRGEQLFARFPARFPSEWGPTRKVALRFWVRTDDASADWVWTTSLTSLRATLTLDTRSAVWPENARLTWSAAEPGDVRVIAETAQVPPR